MTLEFPLNLEIGDTLMVSISLNPDTAEKIPDLKSISFKTCQLLENNNVNPGQYNY